MDNTKRQYRTSIASCTHHTEGKARLKFGQHKEVIQNIHRTVTMKVPALKELSYWERLEAINFPTLEERRVRGDLITTFKFLKQLNNMDSEQFLKRCRD